MLGGALLAWLLLREGMAPERAVDLNQMYLAAFAEVFHSPALAVWVTALFVILSQLKINVTNAYAGSLAWSNFFSRLTHSHPGRVVWMVFNILIALLLMELEVFQAIGQVLGLYSNIAISWFAAVVADLVINKPLGLSPAGIEFRRAHLYDINPVGVGAMGLASVLSVACFIGAFGPTAQPFAPLIAMLTALLAAPLIAWRTQGRYYLARPEAQQRRGRQYCVVCEQRYEPEEMSHCPAYQGPICSLCCSLDVRCDDACKPHARLASQWHALLARVLPAQVLPLLARGLGHYLLLMLGLGLTLALLMGMLYYLEWHNLPPGASPAALQASFVRIFAALWLVGGILAWWMALTHKSRQECAQSWLAAPPGWRRAAGYAIPGNTACPSARPASAPGPASAADNAPARAPVRAAPAPATPAPAARATGWPAGRAVCRRRRSAHPASSTASKSAPDKPDNGSFLRVRSAARTPRNTDGRAAAAPLAAPGNSGPGCARQSAAPPAAR
jgi:hypothetical protein